MKPPRRFITSIINTARKEMPPLPFERGAPRAAMIARRAAQAERKPAQVRHSQSA